MEHDGCVGCKYEMCEPDSIECRGCKQNATDKYTKKTNFDMIKSMSESEFAEWLTTITDDAQLKCGLKCNYCWNEWLREESWE